MKEQQIELLASWLRQWELSPSQGAKVLKIQKSKMSEFLNPNNSRKLPEYIAYHIDTFNHLEKAVARELINQRLSVDASKKPI